MLFGVSKNENIVINRVETRGDKAKIDALLDYIKVKDKVEISSYARLGKVSDANEGDKKRPIKIVLKNRNGSIDHVKRKTVTEAKSKVVFQTR